MNTNREIFRMLERMEKKDLVQDEKIAIIFEYLKKLEKMWAEEFKYHNRRKIGYK